MVTEPVCCPFKRCPDASQQAAASALGPELHNEPPPGVALEGSAVQGVHTLAEILVLRLVKAQQQLQACQLPLCSRVQSLKQGIQAGRTAPADALYRVCGDQAPPQGLHTCCSASMLAQQRCRLLAQQRCRLPAEQGGSAWACRCIRIWGTRPFKAPMSHWTRFTSCQTVCCLGQPSHAAQKEQGGIFADWRIR